MELIEIVRDEIKNELGTKNNRINWLLVSQTFIFAAFGIMIKQDEKYNIEPLISLFPKFGAFLSCLTLLGITGCYLAVIRLNFKYKKLIKDQKDFTTYRILIFKNKSSAVIGILYSYLLCFSFLYLWYMAYTKFPG